MKVVFCRENKLYFQSLLTLSGWSLKEEDEPRSFEGNFLFTNLVQRGN
jgi:hypothetical protein